MNKNLIILIIAMLMIYLTIGCPFLPIFFGLVAWIVKLLIDWEKRNENTE